VAPATRIGGIVLCGGKSRRMGRPKLSLPFGDELMLQRVVRIVGEVVAPIAVVAGPEQELPPLPPGVRIVRDEQEHLGPLAGIGRGLEALAGEVDAAFVASCDVPLLRPAFIRAILATLEEHDAAVPEDETHYHPLAAAYRTSLAANVRALVSAGRLRPVFLFEKSDIHVVPIDELRAVDPDLESLRNMNTPEDYAAALRAAGLAAEA
jgi:molybdopterin-guanine dinucleotide biosynthesis protein A